jgi:hypothetical protein
MRYCKLIIVLIFTNYSAFSQLTVNAGRDTSLCTVYTTVVMGGTPTSSGGHPPYSYKWSCRYFTSGFWHTEAFFLNDPLLPNPTLKKYLNEPINGTVTFILKVTDSNQLSVTDTVNITISSISFMTLRILEGHINPGDSVQIEPANILYGIPPFNYQWEPLAGLSDSTERAPYAKPAITTFYKVTVTDSISCKNFEYYTVYINPASISNQSSANNFLIYPNPITTESRISLNKYSSDNLTIEVFDLDGKNILTDSFYQDYKIGEKIHNTGILFFRIFRKNWIVASGKMIKK